MGQNVQRRAFALQKLSHLCYLSRYWTEDETTPNANTFHRVGVDIMELPLTQNGNRYVVTFIDYLTKWIESFACSDQTSETIAKLLIDHVICRHGVPEYLVSDRGTNLLSSLMQEVYEITGIHKLSTTAYHPQTDGKLQQNTESDGC